MEGSKNHNIKEKKHKEKKKRRRKKRKEKRKKSKEKRGQNVNLKRKTHKNFENQRMLSIIKKAGFRFNSSRPWVQ